MPWNLISKKCDIDNKIVKLNRISASLSAVATQLVFEIGCSTNGVLSGTNQRGERTKADVNRLYEEYKTVKGELFN